MNRFTAAVVAALASTGAAQAGGLDRSGQSILPLFDPAGTLAFSLSHVNPDLRGEDVGNGGRYDAGDSYTTYQLSYADRINDRLSYAVIADQPFGADIFYDDDPTTSNLGGTLARIDSDALSFVGRYEMTDRISVFGGLRAERVDARIVLNGLAYQAALGARGLGAALGDAAAAGSPVAQALVADPNLPTILAGVSTNNPAAAPAAAAIGSISPDFAAAVAGIQSFGSQGGYSVEVDDDWGVGVTLGAAYEIPEIALRLAVTYHSEVAHHASGVENSIIFGGVPERSDLNFASPQSVNVEFQTGVAEDTLLLAGLRWTDWDDFDVIPRNLNADLADIDDSYRWSLGVARRFTPDFVGLASLTYEKDNGNATVSPLGPNDGQIGLSVGGRYTRDALSISGGVNYTKVGSAFAGVADTPVALFDDSSAVGVAFRLAYEF